MPYCTKVDLLKQINEQTLIELTDDAVPPENVQDEVVERAITDADGTIDSYCKGHYAVPLATAPAKIQAISVDIAIYNIYSRRGDSAPDIRKDRFKDAIRFLERVADGKIILDAAPPTQAGTVSSASFSAEPRLFSRTKMRGF